MSEQQAHIYTLVERGDEMTTIQWTDSNGKTYTVDTSPEAQRRNALSLAERIAAAKRELGAKDAGKWAAKVAEQRARIDAS